MFFPKMKFQLGGLQHAHRQRLDTANRTGHTCRYSFESLLSNSTKDAATRRIPRLSTIEKKIGVRIRRGAGILLFSLTLLLPCGCERSGGAADANQSLVEIGEYSLEEGEWLENAGRKPEANQAFRKAIWAFGYHQQLTGEEPLLLYEARQGVQRTAR